MQLNTLDWGIIAVFFIVSLAVGILTSRQSGQSSKEFFLSGRNMPWWLLGISMVATTFSADTPNLVTDIVRKQGVAGNWAWWAFLLTGMLTVFVYARLWRRSGIMTDLEFYEMRYSGAPARFLRGFRAIYLGVFFNVMIMATVCLAGIKIGSVMLGIPGTTTVLLVGIITVAYSALGGLRGIVITDFIQFGLAMVGAVWAAVALVNMPEIGGLDVLFTHPNVVDRLDFLPDFNNPEMYVPLFLIPIAVQWWSVWYPGSEPGGGGYVAQRMLAAKNERHAVGATFLYNAFHYALRPWPWILIALASLIVFPDLDSIRVAFPNAEKVNDDLAYSAMLTFLSPGLKGLVVASLIAALMSTLSTHLNWGASYVVNDFYQRFMKPSATEENLVMVGRITTVVLMVLAALFALVLNNALEAFNILLQVGAGTGLIFILRWFWWRINAFTEIAGMFISFAVALFMHFVYPLLGLPELLPWQVLLLGIAITTVGWLAVTFMTRPTDEATLQSFYLRIKPGGPGWGPVEASLPEDTVATGSGKLAFGILAMLVGAVAVYAVLFATGFYLYGNLTGTLVASGIALVGIAFMVMQRDRF
ncbi:sodium:solute symporter family protein [Neolewinella lacunae]|uniref:Na+:solute symporter n=1 Tax=Neolewinella lacunae TaxID=1517758 RepID=A0A923PJP9_9BACT|nr:sodium:solute symporter family protein [Neolewinella lacunae]MBC6995310.1 Na+:solute symporter [Neolewinella lacunae]MDN3633022.1 sodium:solute symporter family protein [Neolewinella lacunae]